MLDHFVRQDLAENGEYRKVQRLLDGNRQRYEQRKGQYAAELTKGLREAVQAEYDLTMEAVQQGAMDGAEQNAQYLLSSSPIVKALGTDRVMDLQEVVEYARALREPHRFALELGQEYLVSALQTLYQQAGQFVAGMKPKLSSLMKSKEPIAPEEDLVDLMEETWFAQGKDPDYLKGRD
jgi:hypothetical protein